MDPTPYIISAALLGALIGSIGTRIAYSIRLRRIQAKTWSAASLYYRRRYNIPESRL
jgi:hypothetical protein